MLFTGDLVSGTEAERMAHIYKAVQIVDLDEEINRLADRIKGVPKNQLMMMKMMVNQTYENMGLANT